MESLTRRGFCSRSMLAGAGLGLLQHCRELGLGELLDRMHQASSSLSAKRAGSSRKASALDPENLRQCLECVLKRAETVMVVAHP